MAQNGTKMILVFVFLLAGLLVAAQVQAARRPQPVRRRQASRRCSIAFHNPAPWLEMGADFRFREHYGYNWTALNDD